MDYKIVDAHAHLWLKQDTEWDGKPVKSLRNGRSIFLGEEVQMLPPYILDGQNTADIFLSCMDYAQVSGAVITQEFIDGQQNDYLLSVQERWPDRFVCCGMPETRQPGFLDEARRLLDSGFRALKIPAHRLILSDRRVMLNSPEMMEMFALMESRGAILSIDMAEGDAQVAEMEEVIAEHPNLKIAIGHFGMVNRPDWLEQIKLARHPNVMVESGGITWLFHSEFYPYKGAIRAIREAIDLVGADKLMWGSDYPRTIVAITYRMSYDFIQKATDLSEAEKAAILGDNARAFYGFDHLPELPYIKNMSE